MTLIIYITSVVISLVLFHFAFDMFEHYMCIYTQEYKDQDKKIAIFASLIPVANIILSSYMFLVGIIITLKKS